MTEMRIHPAGERKPRRNVGRSMSDIGKLVSASRPGRILACGLR
jgi:hypothetical protein